MTKFTAITLFSMLPYGAVYAQVPIKVIEVESVSMKPTETIPFDREFILKIRFDSKPEYIEIIRNDGRRNWVETLKHRTKGTSTYSIPQIHESNFEFRKDGGKNYLFIKFGAHPVTYQLINNTYIQDKKSNDFLKPGSSYTVLLPKSREKGFEISDKIEAGDQAGAQTSINDHYEVDLLALGGITYHVKSLANANTFYASSLQPFYAKLAAARNAIDHSTTNYSALAIIPNLKRLPESVAEWQGRGSLFEI